MTLSQIAFFESQGSLPPNGVHGYRERVLQRVLSQVPIIRNTQSNLTRLAIKAIRVHSQLDKLTLWYASHPWWVKLILASLVIGLSYVLGSLVCMAEVLSGFTAGIFALFWYYAEDHADVIKQHESEFASDIDLIVTSIQTTIDTFQKIELDIRILLSSLLELNICKASTLASMEEHTQTLEAEQVQFGQVLESLQSKLDDFQHAEVVYQSAHETMSAMTEEFQSSKTGFSELQGQLEGVISQLQAHDSTVTALRDEDGFEEKLAAIMA